MRAQDIKIGESYRHRAHPEYCWAKAIKILEPRQGENPYRFTIVECAWSEYKDADFSLRKHFRPIDLVKP